MNSTPATPDPLHVLIVDDHEVVRLGVRQLLQRLGRPLELTDAADLDAARRALAGGRFDLVLLDLALGEDFALQALPRLREAAAGARIIVLTSLAEQLYAERALQAGADGFVMKTELAATLVDAVQAVLAGEVYLSPSQRSLTLRRMAGHAGEPARPQLSPRELEVLRLVADGCSTREIAERLNRSVKTIETVDRKFKRCFCGTRPVRTRQFGCRRPQELASGRQRNAETVEDLRPAPSKTGFTRGIMLLRPALRARGADLPLVP